MDEILLIWYEKLKIIDHRIFPIKITSNVIPNNNNFNQ